ncbi:hypothetical protein C1M53_26410 [Mesorhizobium sp. Pch-S]|nr:hypothetical protein C1M53_26410 [Mesorhizobium sp. Pch-S]
MENVSSACEKRFMATKERDPLNVKIGAAIKAAREHRKIGSSREIAEAIGTTVGAVGNWESGQNSISANNFFAVADFLNVDARALSQGELVYLDDPQAPEMRQPLQRPVSEVVLKLWAVLGQVLKLKAEHIDQVVDLITERVEAINRRPGRSGRNKSDD